MPADGVWVERAAFNLLVSGCERCMVDKESFKTAFNDCNKELVGFEKNQSTEKTTGFLWALSGFGIGTLIGILVMLFAK